MSRPRAVPGLLTILTAAATFGVATGCAAAPTAPPIDTALVAVAGGVAASSPTHGPAVERDGRASGFGRDALGAALAASHLAARVSPAADPAVADATLTEQCWGDVTAARVRLAAVLPAPDAPPPAPATPRALYYRLLSGDPDDGDGAVVVVSLLADTEQTRSRGALSRMDLTLRWADGDWRLRVPLQRAALHVGTSGYDLLGGVR
ncbi:MAG: hypothetical protein NTW05_03745 [Pseudonocardiales bacterium]|jgi:hypothetical protein|nr:hypothetical protein [Pseudonocardiales bacterium]